MLAKLFNAVAVLALAVVLAGGGFVGYLFGTGRLNPQRVERIVAVVRGELDELPEAGESAQTDAASGAEADVGPVTGRSSDEASARREREHFESLAIERGRADLLAQRRLLDQVMQQVVHEQEQLAEAKATLAKQQEQRTNALLDEGFRKELQYVSGLKPAQAKEHILRVWQRQKADAVRLFMRIEERQGKRILEQFRTPEELKTMTDLLEQIRLQGTPGYANASGKTEGAAAP